MSSKTAIVKSLREAAVKAASQVSAAKRDVKAVKARLKQARKLFKAEKKAAKQIRRKLDAAVAAALTRPRKPAKASKPAAAKKPMARKPPRKKPAAAKASTLRSAADVAKSVIDRLHAPPPLLPPTPGAPGDSKVEGAGEPPAAAMP